MTRSRRTALVLLLGTGAVVVCASPASAHAALLGTDPEDGTVLSTAPSSLTLRFNEPVGTALGGVRVVDPAGERVDDGRPATGDGGRTVTVALPGAGAEGTYVLSWRVVSEDAHPVSGASTFSVGRPSTATVVSAEEGAAGDWLTAARGVSYAGFLPLVGVVTLLLLVWPAGLARPGARRLAWTGWGLTLLGSTGTLLLQGPAAAGLDVTVDRSLLSAVLGTDYGRAHVVRLGLLVVAAGGLVALFRGVALTSSRALPAAAVLALLLAGTWSVAGHAVAGDLTWLALPADALHLLAVGVWTGGLVLLGLVLLRTRPEADVLRRWSRLATGAVVVMVATGSFAAWREVRSLDALTGARYGDLLLLKAALVLGMLVLGALGRRWVRRSAPALLRRSVIVETVLAAAVVSTTAVLVQTPPARTADAAPLSTVVDVPGGTVQVDLDSARVGLNTLHVYLTGPGGRAVDVPEVTARLTRADGESASVAVPRESLGHYETTRLAVPFRGTWRMDVAVRTSDVDVSTASVTTTFR